MNPFKRTPRRGRKTQYSPESLEPRELLTAGAGDTFAIMNGNIPDTGGTTAITFTIDPTHFNLPKGKLALGIDVVPATGSTIKPLISSVDDPHGDLIPQTFHSVYDPHAGRLTVASNPLTSSVITPVTFFPGANRNNPATYTVNVDAEGKTSGDFLLGFYLPGDANGDGKVDKTDVQLVNASFGSRGGSSKYNFNADANRDGRIGLVDKAYVQQNQGVSLDISPIVQANLVPSSVTNSTTRTTTSPTAAFTGSATPGATITYTNTNAPNAAPTTTTTDSAGNYTITVPLVPGQNTFKVQSSDAFGQVITGTLSPVTYNPPATP